MSRVCTGTLLLIICALWAGPAQAQAIGEREPGSGLGSSAELEESVLGHELEGERVRDDLSRFLEREEVATIARNRGIQLDRVSEAAASLSDDQAQAIAPMLERAEAAMQRGGTITISVYTIIIILLLLILLT